MCGSGGEGEGGYREGQSVGTPAQLLRYSVEESTGGQWLVHTPGESDHMHAEIVNLVVLGKGMTR